MAGRRTLLLDGRSREQRIGVSRLTDRVRQTASDAPVQRAPHPTREETGHACQSASRLGARRAHCLHRRRHDSASAVDRLCPDARRQHLIRRHLQLRRRRQQPGDHRHGSLRGNAAGSGQRPEQQRAGQCRQHRRRRPLLHQRWLGLAKRGGRNRRRGLLRRLGQPAERRLLAVLSGAHRRAVGRFDGLPVGQQSDQRLRTRPISATTTIQPAR